MKKFIPLALAAALVAPQSYRIVSPQPAPPFNLGL